MGKLILADKSARDPSNIAPTSERLVNLYPVPAPDGSTGAIILRSVPGMEAYVNAPGPFLRAMTSVEDVLYVVVRGAVYRIGDGGSLEQLATIDDDPVTTIAGHRDMLTISAGGNYYLFSSGSLTQPGSGRLTDVGSVAFSNQYTVLGDGSGREVEWTAVGAPATRSALNFATAEGRDDDIVRIVPAGAYLVVFKARSTELWAVQGAGSAAFARVPGGVYDTGLMSANLVAQTPRALFFVGHDGTVYMTQGADAAAVSNPTINQAIKDRTPTHCFFYEDRGHQFCVIRFDDRPAWVYDVAMDRWHERSTGVKHGPWDVIASAYAQGAWHLGSLGGNIYRMGAAPIDASGPMRRTVVSRPIYMEGKKFSVTMLEILGRAGNYMIEERAPDWILDANGFPIIGQNGQPIIKQETLLSTHKRPARLSVATSRDGGRTFGPYRIEDIGQSGDYSTRTRMFGFGQFEHFTVEVNMTDPIEVPLLGEANIEVT